MGESIYVEECARRLDDDGGANQHFWVSPSGRREEGPSYLLILPTSAAMIQQKVCLSSVHVSSHSSDKTSGHLDKIQ